MSHSYSNGFGVDSGIQVFINILFYPVEFCTLCKESTCMSPPNNNFGFRLHYAVFFQSCHFLHAMYCTLHVQFLFCFLSFCSTSSGRCNSVVTDMATQPYKAAIEQQFQWYFPSALPDTCPLPPQKKDEVFWQKKVNTRRCFRSWATDYSLMSWRESPNGSS